MQKWTENKLKRSIEKMWLGFLPCKSLFVDINIFFLLSVTFLICDEIIWCVKNAGKLLANEYP